MPSPFRYLIAHADKDQKRLEPKYETLGFIVYVLLFLIVMPIGINKFAPKYLMYYMCNIDIIANILTVIKDPNIFGALYLSNPSNLIEYISVIGINYYALLSVFYVVIHFHNRSTTRKAILMAGIVVMVTFLIPTYFIPVVILKLNKKLDQTSLGNGTKVFLMYAIGLLSAFMFIYLEEKAIEYFL